MEFRDQKGSHDSSFTFSLPKVTCVDKLKAALCCGNLEFVYVYSGDELIGKLMKPFRCCDSQCEAIDECQGNDILQMSFTDANDKEQFTLRRKGKGCLKCCVVCCTGPCNLNCKGMCEDGICCFNEIASRQDEIFDVHGPMNEPMSRPPKATVSIISRRGFQFGHVFQPLEVEVHGQDKNIQGDNLLLLLGYVYGMIYQGELQVVPRFPMKEGEYVRLGKKVGASST